MSHLVTIKTFIYHHEMGIVQSLLESEGIHCFTKDEFSVQIQPQHANMIGGIKLQVRENDVDNAIAILKKGGFLRDEDLEPSKSDVKIYNFLSKIPIVRRFLK